MRSIPVKELKDTGKISELAHKSHEPIHVTKNGRPDMVIMSAESFDELERDARTGRIVSLVQEGIDAVNDGKAQDAFQAVAQLRAKYGL